MQFSKRLHCSFLGGLIFQNGILDTSFYIINLPVQEETQKKKKESKKIQIQKEGPPSLQAAI